MNAKPLIAAALALGSIAASPAAQAQRYWGERYEQPYRGGYDGYGRDGYARDAYYRDGYDRGYDGRDYRGYDGRGRGCSNGTTGTVVGALAGGLLGRVIDTRGDRSLGTILGAGAGALAGRAAERSNNPQFCR